MYTIKGKKNGGTKATIDTAIDKLDNKTRTINIL